MKWTSSRKPERRSGISASVSQMAGDPSRTDVSIGPITSHASGKTSSQRLPRAHGCLSAIDSTYAAL